jgi:hypothetical protein
MANRVARKARRNHLIDLTPIDARPDVGQPRRQIGGTLPPEAILWREHELGLMPFLAQRLDERTRNHQVSALDKQRRRCDHRDSH